MRGELRRRRSGFRGVDGSESAVDETERERSVRSSDESVRISRLHELSIDEKILREREQRERAVAFSRRRRKKSTSEELLEALELEDLLEKWPKDVLKCGEVIAETSRKRRSRSSSGRARKSL